MHYTIIGAGAIGGSLAARLSLAGRNVTLVARGARLASLRRDGLELHEGGMVMHARPRIVDLAGCGATDVLVLAVKGQALPALARHLRNIIDPGTSVIPLVNGLPWWFRADNGASAAEILDPAGDLSQAIPLGAVTGAVVYTNARCDGPNRFHVTAAQHLLLGRPGRVDPADAPVAADLRAAGIEVTQVRDIRPELWSKIALNAATNPLSVVSERGIGDMVDDPATRRLVVDVLDEVRHLALVTGCAPSLSTAELLDRCRKAGGFETSMLQDYRMNRPLELAAICNAPLQLAGAMGLTMPILHRVCGMARDKSRIAVTAS